MPRGRLLNFALVGLGASSPHQRSPAPVRHGDKARSQHIGTVHVHQYFAIMDRNELSTLEIVTLAGVHIAFFVGLCAVLVIISGRKQR